MNKYLSLFFLIILPAFAFAQQKQNSPSTSSAKGFMLDIAGGLSVPVAVYALSNVSNEQSGFSKTGPVIGFGCEWVGKKNFGIAIQYMFQLNPLKSSAKDLVIKGMTVPVGSGNWTNHYLMGGPVFMKYFGKIFFEVKALIGVVISTSPLFKTEDSAFKSVSNNTGTGFSLGIGAGVGYAVSSNVTLKLNAGYLYGTPKIHRQYGAQVVEIRDSAFVYSAPVTIDTKKIVSTFNVGISAIIKLSK